MTPAVGVAICGTNMRPVARYKRYLLSTWADGDRRNVVDSIIYPIVFEAWVQKIYLRQKDPDRREELKSVAMGGSNGEMWAQEYDSRPLDFNSKIGNMRFLDACPAFAEIERICDCGEADAIIQIGSSSGREIAYFAQKYPHMACVGSDIYEEVVSFSRKSHRRKNLTFELASAKDLSDLLTPYAEKRMIVFSSGSLQYVQPEHLHDFFALMNRFQNLRLFVSEPANESQGRPDELCGSLWRGNFSYTHDYRHYAESSGMETLESRIIRPYWPYEDFPVHRDTVHYFYHGRSR